MRYLNRGATFFTLFLLISAAPYLQAQGEERRSRRDEQRKAESLARFSQRLNRLSSRPGLTPENGFLHEQVSSLLERSRQAPAGSYLFDRLESAMEDLLDASGHLVESRQSRRERDDETEEARRRAARDLERTYFRIQQGDYFAVQSRERNAAEYLLMARRLYQQARAAYDAGNYGQARGLGEAAREVISSLESLAQAAVPIPEPPRLSED